MKTNPIEYYKIFWIDFEYLTIELANQGYSLRVIYFSWFITKCVKKLTEIVEKEKL